MYGKLFMFYQIFVSYPCVIWIINNILEYSLELIQHREVKIVLTPVKDRAEVE